VGGYALTLRAQADLDDIWDHTAKRWGVEQAETYLRELGRHLAMAADKPAIGRSCPEIRPGYYRTLSGSHVLFYRMTERGIDVVRILHRRMDFEQQL
jgi:toxin ParE1/3/4